MTTLDSKANSYFECDLPEESYYRMMDSDQDN